MTAAAAVRGVPATVEGLAVLAAARWDPEHPSWEPAVRVAFARRGTRDAVIVLTARDGDWHRAAAALAGVPPTGRFRTDQNIAAVLAIAHWTTGDTDAASAALPEAGHQMGDMVRRMIARRSSAAEWLSRIAAVDPVRCMEFDG